MDENKQGTGPDASPAVQPNVDGQGQAADSGRVDGDDSAETVEVAETATDDVVVSDGEAEAPEAAEEPAAEEAPEAEEEAE